MKARIVERTHQDGSKKHWIQTKFFGIWFDRMDFDTLQLARSKMCFYDGTKVVDRVVDGHSHREPDPAVFAVVAKLRDIFKARLEEEDDPDAFLDALKPMVFHERRDLISLVVNEAAGKLYAFDNPVQWGKSILVDGDFAQKVLALNGFPN